MLLVQYLDQLPAIPVDIIKKSYYEDQNRIRWRSGSYTRWLSSQVLEQWLIKNISDNMLISSEDGSLVAEAGVHVFSGNASPHCDRRKWALNYIFDLGGNEVDTVFWIEDSFPLVREMGTYRSGTKNSDKKLNEVWRTRLVPNRWHLLNPSVIHSVENVVGIRRAVSISIFVDNPFNLLPQYKNSIGW